METFRLHHTWAGSTAEASYTRAAEASADGKPSILQTTGIGDAVDPTRWNPEDLLGASLAQCHTLTFLSLANKVRLDVVRIETDVEVELETVEKITRVARITLRPVIHLAAGGDAEKALTMYDKAHKYCFIANSLTSEVVLEPTVQTA